MIQREELHNKKNLMDELAKMRRIITRDYPEANVEALIVLDGTTGQNALEQARQFSNVTELDGIVITKLDGTAKGGIAIAIQAELDVPVKFIGVGEKIGDLQRCDPQEYVNALFADFDEDNPRSICSSAMTCNTTAYIMIICMYANVLISVHNHMIFQKDFYIRRH